MTTGYVVPRPRAKGFRYTAYIRETPGAKPQSIGTFDYKDDAEKAILLAKLTGTVPAKKQAAKATSNAKRKLDDYFTNVFLPGVRNPRTRKGYRSSYINHVQPLLGNKVLEDITRADIKKMIDGLFRVGRTESAVVSAKKCVSAVLGRAQDDEDIPTNPAFNIRIKVTKMPRASVDPKEVKTVIAELDGVAKLFAETTIETGCRFGEVTELRPLDIDWKTGKVTVSRAVADVGAADNPDKTGRFYVKSAKGGRYRITSVSRPMLKKLAAHVKDHGIGNNDLLFPASLVSPGYKTRPGGRIEDKPITQSQIEAAGFTEPNAEGRVYQHGTNTGYTKGKCRCELCRQAAREQSRQYRSTIKKSRRAPSRTTNNGENTTDHLPNDVWNRHWREAVKSTLARRVRTHDLRHAHATWLIKQGMDLHTLKERLGHSSIRTTEVYLHDIKAMESNASDIMDSLLNGDDE